MSKKQMVEAQKLRDFMDTSKLSQTDMAKYLGVSSQSVSKWLSTNEMPKLIEIVINALANDLTDHTIEMYVIRGPMEKLKPYLIILKQAGISTTEIKV